VEGRSATLRPVEKNSSHEEASMPDIMHLIKIHASVERVYAALTTAEGIRNWWTRDADLDSKVGGTGQFRFYAGTSITEVIVEKLTPPLHVGWKLPLSFRPEWEGSSITFDLRAEGDETVLLFAQRGFKEADEVYALTNTGWAYYLVSLQQYLETGEGAPNPDIDFSRVIAAR
jgi:uncharacterized protein YndB with AHSA1/START domain